MKIDWIVREGSKELILFFNGWGQDDTIIRHLKRNCDLLMVSDYCSIDDDFPDISLYENINIVAWSMGVWAAANIVKRNCICYRTAIALNGTERPIDNNYGIPEKIFALTLKGMQRNGCARFAERMFETTKKRAFFPEKITLRSEENQIEELNQIGEESKLYKAEINWTCALVSLEDLIYLPENQRKYWKDRNVEMKHKQGGHCPFADFRTWNEILNL